MSDLRRLMEEVAVKNAAFDQKQRARVAEAKIAAARTSKEPFCTEKLSELLTSAAPMLDEMSDQELFDLEVSYYLNHPEMQTLRELAAILNSE